MMTQIVFWVIALVLAAAVIWAFVLESPDEVGLQDDAPVDDSRQFAELTGRGHEIEVEPDGRAHTHGAVLRGVVVRVDGTPMADVPVAIRAGRGRNVYRDAARRERMKRGVVLGEPDGPVLQTVTTGPAGRFQIHGLALGDYYVVEALPPAPYGVARKSIGSHEPWAKTLRFVVAEGSTLRGRVVGVSGGVKAWVSASTATLYRPMEHVVGRWRPQRIETDHEGRFALERVPDGEIYVNVTLPGCLTINQISTKAPSDEELLIRIDEDADASIAGRVTDMQQRAVAGATIAVSTKRRGGRIAPSMMQYATTDGDGNYQVHGMLSGDLLAVTVVADGYMTLTHYGQGQPAPGGEVTRVDLQVVRGSVIRGTVRNEDGEPLGGAQVRWAPGARMTMSQEVLTTARADGAFELAMVPPEMGFLHALVDGYYQERPPKRRGLNFVRGSSVKVELEKEGSKLTQDIVLKHGIAVGGRVVDEEGAAVAGVVVTATAQRNIWVRQNLGLGMADAMSDDDGAFRFAGLEPGIEWSIQAQHAGRMSPAASVQFDAQSPDDVELVLRTPGVISGHVLGPDDAPVAQVQVGLTRGRTALSAMTDALGAFSFGDLPAGSYELTLGQALGRSSADNEIELDWGVHIEDVELRTAKVLSLGGIVVDGRGKPITGTSLLIYKASSGRGRGPFGGGRPQIGRTGGDGTFLIEGLEEGGYKIRIGNQEVEGTFTAGESNVRVVHGAAPKVLVEGTIKLPDGEAPANARVTFNSSDGQIQMGFGAYYQNGSFGAELPPDQGPFELRVSYVTDAGTRPHNVQKFERSGVTAADSPLMVQLELGLVVAGHVRDAAGAGIADVVVSLQNAGELSARHDAEDRSGADGAFRLVGLGVGTAKLGLKAPEGWVQPPLKEIATGAEGIVIVLERALTISGFVRDESGEPIEGVRVTAMRPMGGAHWFGRHYDVTKSDGHFELTGLAGGMTYRIRARLSNAPADKPFLEGTLDDVSGGTTDLDIRMQRGVFIEGLVVDTEGHAVPGHGRRQRVRAKGTGEHPTRHRATLQVDGTFRLGPLRPGPYELRGPNAPEPVTVNAPAAGIRLTVPMTYTLRGAVVGEEPLNRFHVTFFTTTGSNGKSLRDGTFELEGLTDDPGTLFVHNQEDDRYGLLKNVHASAGSIKITLVRGETIEGRVEGLSKDRGRRPRVTAKGQGIQIHGIVDKEGGFVIRGVPPGAYELSTSLSSLRSKPLVDVRPGASGVVLQIEKK